MSLYALKSRFQRLLRPAVRLLHAAGITANQVTVFACVVSVVLGIGIAFQAGDPTWFLLLPVWFLLRMALNAIDGMLAREFDQASTLGAYLNELTDVISDAALYLPFAFVAGTNAMLVALVTFLATLSEMAGMLGAALGGTRRYDGPMGKSDRAFVFGALGLVVGLGIHANPWMPIVLGTVSALTALTIVNRVRRGITDIGARERA